MTMLIDSWDILRAEGIPYVAWGIIVPLHYFLPDLCHTANFDAMVQDVDAACQALIRHGYELDPKMIPRHNRQLKMLAPPREFVLEARRLRRPRPVHVCVMLDREWHYDVAEHYKRHPDTHWPPLAAFMDATITLLLDRDLSHLEPYLWDRDSFNLDNELDYVYEPLAPGVRDLTDQLSFENRQYHIDRAYGTWRYSDIEARQKHTCEVYRQLRAGTRGIRDPVAEYEACAADAGLELETYEYEPVPPQQRRVRYHGMRKRSRKYHIGNKPPAEIVERMRAVCERLHAKVPVRDPQAAYSDWATTAGLHWDPDAVEVLRDPGVLNRARRIRQQIVPTTIAPGESVPTWRYDDPPVEL